MKIKVLPETRPGKWSLAFLGGFILFFGFFMILVAARQRGGDTFFSNLRLSIPMLLASILGISAFISAGIGILFRHERAVLVFLAAVIGLLLLVFVLGEIISPH